MFLTMFFFLLLRMFFLLTFLLAVVWMSPLILDYCGVAIPALWRKKRTRRVGLRAGFTDLMATGFPVKAVVSRGAKQKGLEGVVGGGATSGDAEAEDLENGAEGSNGSSKDATPVSATSGRRVVFADEEVPVPDRRTLLLSSSPENDPARRGRLDVEETKKNPGEGEKLRSGSHEAAEEQSSSSKASSLSDAVAANMLASQASVAVRGGVHMTSSWPPPRSDSATSEEEEPRQGLSSSSRSTEKSPRSGSKSSESSDKRFVVPQSTVSMRVLGDMHGHTHDEHGKLIPAYLRNKQPTFSKARIFLQTAQHSFLRTRRRLLRFFGDNSSSGFHVDKDKDLLRGSASKRTMAFVPNLITLAMWVSAASVALMWFAVAVLSVSNPGQAVFCVMVSLVMVILTFVAALQDRLFREAGGMAQVARNSLAAGGAFPAIFVQCFVVFSFLSLFAAAILKAANNLEVVPVKRVGMEFDTKGWDGGPGGGSTTTLSGGGSTSWTLGGDGPSTNPFLLGGGQAHGFGSRYSISVSAPTSSFWSCQVRPVARSQNLRTMLIFLFLPLLGALRTLLLPVVAFAASRFYERGTIPVPGEGKTAPFRGLALAYCRMSGLALANVLCFEPMFHLRRRALAFEQLFRNGFSLGYFIPGVVDPLDGVCCAVQFVIDELFYAGVKPSVEAGVVASNKPGDRTSFSVHMLMAQVGDFF